MSHVEIDPIDLILVSHRITMERTERLLHMHNNAYEIMLFKRGNVDYFINNITYHLNPGDMTLICPNDIHGFFIKDDSPYERYPVHIEESVIKTLSSSQTDLCKCFHDLKPNRVYQMSRDQIHEFEYYAGNMIREQDQGGYGSDIKIRAYMSFLLVLINKAFQHSGVIISNISPQLIKDAICFIDEHLTAPITIQTIADALNISRSRISHLFKEYTGISLWNYITIRRIQHAQGLILRGASITAACYDSGFHDYAHFIKVFSRIVGVSPGIYLRNGGAWS